MHMRPVILAVAIGGSVSAVLTGILHVKPVWAFAEWAVSRRLASRVGEREKRGGNAPPHSGVLCPTTRWIAAAIT